ncbi:MAG: EthD family reductase [Bacteroidota bacterium]|nr:EthD family reductase [Bacteroidota bacterium]
MVKLIAYYKEPADKEDFDKKYFEDHLPLAKKMPGLIKTEIARLKNLGEGNSKYYMQADMYFENRDVLNSAMSSAEGKAAAKNLMSFAKEIVSMSVGEILE